MKFTSNSLPLSQCAFQDDARRTDCRLGCGLHARRHLSAGGLFDFRRLMYVSYVLIYHQVNLSCNFFRGTFDIPQYIELVDKYWLHLEKVEKLNRDLQEAEHTNVGSEKRKYKRN